MGDFPHLLLTLELIANMSCCALTLVGILPATSALLEPKASTLISAGVKAFAC